MGDEVAAIIRASAHRLWPELIRLQRELHEHPELGFEEHRTAQLIATRLAAAGCALQAGIAGTGVVAEIPGRCRERSVLVRVDIDAFPIGEATGLPWASRVPGVSHACGHDAHAAIGVGVALLLQSMPALPAVTAKVLFQPAEERPLCEEGGDRPYREGARATPAAAIVIREGILENPPVQAAFGLHLWPWLQVGQVGVGTGPAMAGVANFLITLMGQSAHAAVPHEGIDTLLASAHLLTMLQSLVARQTAPGEPLVVNVGTIRGGDRRNVVADRVDMTGTVRSVRLELLAERVPERLRAMLEGLAQALGVRYELEYEVLLGPVVNEPALTERTQKAIAAVLGQAAVVCALGPAMTSEDFALYAGQVPAVYLKIGCTAAGERPIPLHSRGFRFDERAMLVGLQAMAAAVWAEAEWLGRQGGMR